MTAQHHRRDPRAFWTPVLAGCMLAAACGGAESAKEPAAVKSATTTPAAVSTVPVATQETSSAARVAPPARRVARTSAARHRSTLDGLYTAEQAKRGKDVYFGNCRSCHSAATHTGATFAAWWQGKPLADLFMYVATKMPKNDPGSLAPEDAADVVAYLLQLNAMPTGKAELPPDPDALAKYRIEVK